MACTSHLYFDWSGDMFKVAELLNFKSSLVYANDTKSLQKYVLSCSNVHGAFKM
jgi:hypothetical protein